MAIEDIERMQGYLQGMLITAGLSSAATRTLISDVFKIMDKAVLQVNGVRLGVAECMPPVVVRSVALNESVSQPKNLVLGMLTQESERDFAL